MYTKLRASIARTAKHIACGTDQVRSIFNEKSLTVESVV